MAVRPEELDVVTVLVVDDQQPFRAAAKRVVELTPGFTWIGEATSGHEAVALGAALAPALVLMDINLPDLRGTEATRQLLADRPSTVVVLLSTYDLDQLPDDVGTSGAVRYVDKSEFSSAVLRAVWRDTTR